MLKVALVISLLLLPAILFMGFKVFFTRDGEFVSTHVDTNDALRKKGIMCARAQDKAERIEKRNRVKEKQ